MGVNVGQPKRKMQTGNITGSGTDAEVDKEKTREY